MVAPSIYPIRAEERTRAAPATFFGVLFTAGLLAGCGDLTTPAPARRENDRAPGFTRSAAGVKTEYSYVEVKKNGRTKLYRVKIDKGRRTLEFQTVAEEGAYTTASAS